MFRKVFYFTCFVFLIYSQYSYGAEPTLSQAVEFMEQKQYESAYDALSAIYRKNTSQQEVKFLLGLAAAKTKRYSESILHFEELQVVRQSDQVKFQLANVYLLAKNFSRSKQLFQEIYENNPPEPVQKKILQYLNFIAKIEHDPNARRASFEKEYGHVFSGYIATGFQWDSNPRLSPINDTVSTIIGDLKLDASMKERSDVMNFYQLGLNYAYRFHDTPWSIKTRFMGYAGFYAEEKDLDFQAVSLQTGIAYDADRFGVELYGTLGTISQGYDAALNSIGGGAQGYFNVTPQVQIAGGWQYAEKRYFDYASEVADNHKLFLGVVTKIQDIHLLSVFGGYEWEDATYEQDSYERNWALARYEVSLPKQYTPYIYGRYQATDYQGHEWIFDKTREDHETELGLGVRKVLWENLEEDLVFDVDCRYVYTNRESNISLYDNTRNAFTLQFGLSF